MKNFTQILDDKDSEEFLSDVDLNSPSHDEDSFLPLTYPISESMIHSDKEDLDPKI